MTMEQLDKSWNEIGMGTKDYDSYIQGVNDFRDRCIEELGIEYAKFKSNDIAIGTWEEKFIKRNVVLQIISCIETLKA